MHSSNEVAAQQKKAGAASQKRPAGGESFLAQASKRSKTDKGKNFRLPPRPESDLEVFPSDQIVDSYIPRWHVRCTDSLIADALKAREAALHLCHDLPSDRAALGRLDSKTLQSSFLLTAIQNVAYAVESTERELRFEKEADKLKTELERAHKALEEKELLNQGLEGQLKEAIEDLQKAAGEVIALRRQAEEREHAAAKAAIEAYKKTADFERDAQERCLDLAEDGYELAKQHFAYFYPTCDISMLELSFIPGKPTQSAIEHSTLSPNQEAVEVSSSPKVAP